MQRLRAATLCVATLAIAGCASWRSAEAPIYTQVEAGRCALQVDTLLVLLPGVHSHPDEFVREGFLQAVADARLAVDVLRADVHLNYYEKNTIATRLSEDIVAPARARGYRSIWIAGISLGGLGGLIYAQERPGELSGLVLLAPYLGEPAIPEAVARAGGLANWQTTTPPASSDIRLQRETALWHWLQRYASPTPSNLPPLYLGYGRTDRFAATNNLLADVLPRNRVFTTDGGHDWAPWRRLWQAMLPTLPLPRCPP